MADTIIENLDSLNETAPEGETDAEKVVRIEETNKKLYERAKKAEAEAKSLKEKPPIIQPQEQPKPSDILKSDEFRLHRMGYDEGQIEVIMRNGGAKILEDKAHPLVLGLQAQNEQRRAEEASSRASEGSGMSEIERKYTEQDLRNMKKEDLEKLLPHTNN